MRFSLKISAVPGILTAVSFLELRLGLSLYEDHIIQWSPNNSRFGYNNKPLLVKEGDNIVFLCPNERRHKYTLYWTFDYSAYMQCKTSNQPDVHELMRCDANSKVYEFVLKVSLFSELMHIPQFYPGVPVYFLNPVNLKLIWEPTPDLCIQATGVRGQSQLCRQMNFKLISRLASDTQRSESSKCGNNEDYANNGTILGNVSQQNQAQEPNLHSTDAHLRHEMWRSYRFLLLPGSLALLTLIGMQIVICSFWIPRSCTHQLKNPFNKNPKNASEDFLEGMETAPLRCRFCYIQRPIANSHGPVETNSFTRFMEHRQHASVPPRIQHKLSNCALSKQEDDVEKDIHKFIYYQCSPSKRVKLKVPMRMCYPPRHRTHTSNIASVISNNFVTPHLELHSIGKCTSPYIYSEREKQKSVFITGQANDNISI